MKNNELLIKVEGVSKKFCKDLKTSLWYGVKDLILNVRGDENERVLRAKEFWAIKDINFELRRGECLGLIGHNGAGKSTLLKILNGLIKPDAGKITIKGRVGALIELGAGFNPILTGRENIYNNGAVLGFTKAEIDDKIEEIIDFSEIRDFIDMPVQNYSSGMRMRLGFSVAAQMEPDVLLIDEVLAVGDLGFVIKGLNKMSEVIPNTAVIFVSHSMQMISRICTDVLLLDKGTNEFYSSDISTAIRLYINRFDKPDKVNQGNNKIELLKIEFSKNNIDFFENESSIYFETNDTLYLKVKLKLDPSIKKYELGVLLLDLQLREVLECHSSVNRAYFEKGEKDEKYFLIEIPDLKLATGKISLTFFATDSETNEIFCRTTNATSFNFNAFKIGWATSMVESSWKEINKID